MTDHDDDILARNRALDQKIEQTPVAARLRRLDTTVKWLAISVALDILLSIGLAVLGKVAYDASRNAESASHKATLAASQTRINCLAGNQTRKSQQQLWNFVLSFPPPPGETPEQLRRRASDTATFKAYIKKVFAPRDCSQNAKAPSQPKKPAPLASPSAATSPNGGAAEPVMPHVTVTVVVSQRPSSSYSPEPTPSSHSPPPPTQSPSPSPSPTKTCIVIVCLPSPIGARSWPPLPSAPNASTITATADGITPTQIESLATASRPSTTVFMGTAVLPSPIHQSLDRLLVPWLAPTRALISIQSSSWAIRVAIPLMLGT